MDIAPGSVPHGHRTVWVDSTRHYLSPATARELRCARRKLGMSQRATARATGVSQGHIAHLELCQRAPSTETAEMLIRGLRLEPDAAARLMAEAVPGAGRSWRAPEQDEQSVDVAA